MSVGKMLPVSNPSAYVGDQQQLDQRKSQENSEVDTDLPSLFTLLEKDVVGFVRNELKRLQKILTPLCSDVLESHHLDDEERRSSEAVLKITLDFLRRMKQDELSTLLRSKAFASVCQCQLKSSLKKKFQCVFEGIGKAGHPTFLKKIYTELQLIEGWSAGVNDEHEVQQIETASRKPERAETTIRPEDIFKPSPGRCQPIRTVMTRGVAGIGKTVLTQKFTLDWAEDQTNQDIHFLFPFTFRELNLLKQKRFSLVELIHDFFTETKEVEIFRVEELQVVFIFDGLDECRLPLDFLNNETLTDFTKSTTVDVLLTNLIRGNLLPSARLWITTRPAAANQIPPECIDMVTEVRGFTDPEKEAYFRKRFRDDDQASRIISHIRTSRSLHIMCHIPVFCWITATVLEDVLKTSDEEELPRTLTEMYIYFLLVQFKLKNKKYYAGTETLWGPENTKMIESLGKLAFEQLQKGNLIFYESDLGECGIDVRAASVYSGVFTQIFKEERGLYLDKVFCFVHLSVQEFLAALHVHLMFNNCGVNLLAEDHSASRWSAVFRPKSKLTSFYQNALNQALKSSNGHLDLFLRFLLGLSVQANQKLLHGLLRQTGRKSKVNQSAIRNIKDIIRETPSERTINLFHCLNELNDHSLEEEIQLYLSSGSLSAEVLSPSQWSALVFIILSDKDLALFDLKKYSASEEAFLRLLPAVKASNKAMLSGCNLSWRSCATLSSVFSSHTSNLRELDLSNNDLLDHGVLLLCDGLKSPLCTVEVLGLAGCQITEEGCAALALVLRSKPCHLRELDLSFNCPGDSGLQLLTAALNDPLCSLETLRMENCGQQRLRPGVSKFACELVLDPCTAYRKLSVSEDKRTVTTVRDYQQYPDNPNRFECFCQLLCATGLTGRCYWEVEWRGVIHVAVTYEGIKRKGNSSTCRFGMNDQSWSLCCSSGGYAIWHNSRVMDLPLHSSSSSLPASVLPNRVAVYVDCPAGILSFYRVSSNTLIHLHTFSTTFTGPLFAGFGIGVGFGIQSSGSVSLCKLEECEERREGHRNSLM
ncbi:NACHT, LRR and PYD domains-containing protein 2-like isoform X2 [Takifugu rubripes]|nr:NACHT, LRR and PYD domains-containing protein 2-like isoform X2 [Takifugu rubripes]|eukprot:XP_003977509.2 PREDICTED: NACHT, LRR and PYD domains-containing protein 2-like isoform X2 [Takifugu rubripes]